MKLHDTWVRILLYADDGALVASSAEDLQYMLNFLKQYCAKWRMFVNIKNTKVMVFSASRAHHNNIFVYNGAALEVVSSFKYLGVMFSNECSQVRYSASIDHRLTQARVKG